MAQIWSPCPCSCTGFRPSLTYVPNEVSHMKHKMYRLHFQGNTLTGLNTGKYCLGSNESDSRVSGSRNYFSYGHKVRSRKGWTKNREQIATLPKAFLPKACYCQSSSTLYKLFAIFICSYFSKFKYLAKKSHFNGISTSRALK